MAQIQEMQQDQQVKNQAEWNEMSQSEGDILIATIWNIFSAPFHLAANIIWATTALIAYTVDSIINLFIGNFKQAGKNLLMGITEPIIAIASPIIEFFRYQGVIFSYPFRNVKYSPGGLTHPDSIPSLDNPVKALCYNPDYHMGKKTEIKNGVYVIKAPDGTSNATYDYLDTSRTWAIEKVLGLPDTYVNRFKKEANTTSQEIAI